MSIELSEKLFTLLQMLPEAILCENFTNQGHFSYNTVLRIRNRDGQKSGSGIGIRDKHPGSATLEM